MPINAVAIDDQAEEDIPPVNISMFGNGGVRYVKYIDVSTEDGENYILGENTPVSLYIGTSNNSGKKYVLMAFKSTRKAKDFISSGLNRREIRGVLDAYCSQYGYEPCNIEIGLRKYMRMSLGDREDFAIAFVVKPISPEE
jgi:hypothetical protein